MKQTIFIYLLFFWQAAEAQPHLITQKINTISDRNFYSSYSWAKVNLESKENDSLIFTLPQPDFHTFGLHYENIVCIANLKYGNIYRLVIYYKHAGDTVRKYTPYIFGSSDSVMLLQHAFEELFIACGHNPASQTCAQFENDRIAVLLEIRFIRDAPGIKNTYIRGVDSVCSGHIIHRYLNDSICLERNISQVVLHGYQRDYFEQGGISYEGEFVNGLPIGVHLYYFETGKISQRRNFLNGQEHGETISYWDNGQMNTRSIMEYGILISEEAWYEDGTPQGELIRFSD